MNAARSLAAAPSPGALRLFQPDEDISEDLILSGELKGQVDQLARELRYTQRFIQAGVDPPTRVLFSGPSGTGKTLAARWLAFRMKAPLAVTDVSAVVGSHLGETANNLRQCFEAATAAKAFLFLDEIDSICARRGSLSGSSGAEELERATTTLFQQLDWLKPDRVVIAATNFPDELDDALRRRLTTEIAFSLPDRDARRSMLERWLGRSPLCSEQLDALADGSEGLSGAQLRAKAMAQARRAIMAMPEERKRPQEKGAPHEGVKRGQEILRLLDSMSGGEAP
jgi:ATP-dependent 26S proteasome regulatory subunit